MYINKYYSLYFACLYTALGDRLRLVLGLTRLICILDAFGWHYCRSSGFRRYGFNGFIQSPQSNLGKIH